MRTQSLTNGLRDYATLKHGYDQVVGYMKRTGHYDEPNMNDTAKRAAVAMTEMVLPKQTIIDGINEILTRCFPAEGSGSVISADNMVISLCPHHLLPVVFTVDIAYISIKGAGYLGISKLTRVAQMLGKAPMLQEDYTRLLADAFHGPWFPSEGSAVHVSGWHSCLALRGAKSNNTRAITTELRGCFLENNSCRSEFFDSLLLHNMRNR